jgi:hypothetical protein
LLAEQRRAALHTLLSRWLPRCFSKADPMLQYGVLIKWGVESRESVQETLESAFIWFNPHWTCFDERRRTVFKIGNSLMLIDCVPYLTYRYRTCFKEFICTVLSTFLALTFCGLKWMFVKF